MKTIGAYDAKTRLSAILEEVRKGERFAITKHGVTVALLVPAEEKSDPSHVIQQLRHLSRGKTLQGFTLRQLIEEGRRR